MKIVLPLALTTAENRCCCCCLLLKLIFGAMHRRFTKVASLALGWAGLLLLLGLGLWDHCHVVFWWFNEFSTGVVSDGVS